MHQGAPQSRTIRLPDLHALVMLAKHPLLLRSTIVPLFYDSLHVQLGPGACHFLHTSMLQLHTLSIVESATDRLLFDENGHECRGRWPRWASGRPIQAILDANTSVPKNCGRLVQVAALADFTCAF